MDVTDLKFASVATAEILFADGTRSTRNPGDDLSDLPAETRGIIEAHWTPQRVAEWDAFVAAMESGA